MGTKTCPTCDGAGGEWVFNRESGQDEWFPCSRCSGQGTIEVSDEDGLY
jgi:DnaJ-class molecular chaperone